jgi:hypothetical protein
LSDREVELSFAFLYVLNPVDLPICALTAMIFQRMDWLHRCALRASGEGEGRAPVPALFSDSIGLKAALRSGVGKVIQERSERRPSCITLAEKLYRKDRNGGLPV